MSVDVFKEQSSEKIISMLYTAIDDGDYPFNDIWKHRAKSYIHAVTPALIQLNDEGAFELNGDTFLEGFKLSFLTSLYRQGQLERFEQVKYLLSTIPNFDANAEKEHEVVTAHYHAIYSVIGMAVESIKQQDLDYFLSKNSKASICNLFRLRLMERFHNPLNSHDYKRSYLYIMAVLLYLKHADGRGELKLSKATITKFMDINHVMNYCQKNLNLTTQNHNNFELNLFNVWVMATQSPHFNTERFLQNKEQELWFYKDFQDMVNPILRCLNEL